jgi:hypothetical protein
MTTIKEFLEDKFPVEGHRYSELTPVDKEALLKYEIAIIDLDLQQDDPQIIELFKRLNRTFYALSTIEKLSTEYGSSEFMLVAKLLAGELKKDPEAEELIEPDRHEYDPNITPAFTSWAGGQKISSYMRLVLESSMFSKYEISRQVHLMFSLNVMATLIDGYYNRNDNATRFLETRADEFPEKQKVVEQIERAAAFFNRFRFRADSYWYGKSNAFTLLVTLGQFSGQLEALNFSALKSALLAFAEVPPADYALAAKEGVNNRKERLVRSTYVRSMVEAAL